MVKAIGRVEWDKVQKGLGLKLSRTQAIKAKCYDCMGMYKDGKEDCLTPECPLYKWMAYRSKKD